MTEAIDIVYFDSLIDAARTKFRILIAKDASLFGGPNNPRIASTIGANAPYGTIAVPAGIDTTSTEGLMAGVDLTLLNKDAPIAEVEKIAERAVVESAATVCVYPKHVKTVQDITDGNPPPIAVVGFPFVAEPSASAKQETVQQTGFAIDLGAKEIDMVLALNFKDGDPDYAAHYNYIRAVVEAADPLPVKVILETAYLNDAQKVEASLIAKLAGATFVKTSTGFAEDGLMRPELPKSQKGATPYDVALMRRTVGDTTLTDEGAAIPMGVKASGGVRNRAQAIAVYEAGANRIGASGGIDLTPTEEAGYTMSRAATDANATATGPAATAGLY